MKKSQWFLRACFAVFPLSLFADVPQDVGEITPVVEPIGDGAHFFFTSDFIWWKASIGSMAYAATGVADNDSGVPLGTSPKQGRIKTPDFDFEPGFKVGAGLNFAYDGWDLYACYTWLNGGNNRNHLDAKAGQGEIALVPTTTPYGEVALVSLVSASASWQQHFNVLDLELGRNFFISRRLTLRPFIGLKAAWITDKLEQRFTSTDTSFPLHGLIFNIHHHRQQKMWGIGTRGGVDTAWHFAKHWGVYGDIAFTALWGDFDTKVRERYFLLVNNQEFNDLDTVGSSTEVNMVFETGIGLTYTTRFHRDRYQFTAKAGWEEQVWFNFNHFTDLNNTADLSLHGLTLQFSFGF